jgi:hypothetical protein
MAVVTAATVEAVTPMEEAADIPAAVDTPVEAVTLVEVATPEVVEVTTTNELM